MKRLFKITNRRTGASLRKRHTEERTGESYALPRRATKNSGLAWRIKVSVLHHLQAFFYSLGQLSRTPLSTLMSALVIGIALALPAGLHVLIKNAQRLSVRWGGEAQISLFLKHKISDEQALKLAQQLRAWPAIGSVQTRARAQALEEFRQLSGFSEALKALNDNPLPALLLVRPANADPKSTERLLGKLRALPEVEIAQLDMQWLKRLSALMAIAQRGVLLLAALFALGVLLIMGNTIRLAIQSRREEIEITKLVGATDAFIRRPFLYSGLWYGLFGGAIACLLAGLFLWFLNGPVRELSALYHSDFDLSGVDAQTLVLLPVLGALLGVLGSLLAVKRHLTAIAPV